MIMTTEQLKAKIKDLFFADHAEAMGMPEILNALADAVAALEATQPIEVSNITEIDGSVLDSLQPGQNIIKVTGNQKHTYTVTYKGEGSGEGICLSYFDAGLLETVSYDRTESGWAYNSTDSTPVS